MKIYVKVKPNSRIESVAKLSDNSIAVSINAPAKEGRANKRVVELLSEHYDIPKSRITIKSGRKSRIKVVEII